MKILLFFLSTILSQSILYQIIKHTNLNNPIIADMIADPSIVKYNGTWNCYATTDGYGQGLATSGPPVVWKSKDFVNWSFDGIFFPSDNGQKYWAPSKLVFANGRYWLYPTLNSSIHDPQLNRTEIYSAENVADGSNGTRWMTANDDPAPSLSIDLGTVQKIHRIDAYFTVPTAGTAYSLEYSKDGMKWKKCGDNAEFRIQSPHTELLSVQARYFRLTILKGDAGLWELKVY